jgi:protoheme IX farnesyltransferase
VTAVLLLIVSLLPILELSSIYHAIFLAAGAIYLGWIYLKASIEFAKEPNDVTAKSLMRKSLVYLPAYMLVLILAYLIK